MSGGGLPASLFLEWTVIGHSEFVVSSCDLCDLTYRSAAPLFKDLLPGITLDDLYLRCMLGSRERSALSGGFVFAETISRHGANFLYLAFV